MKRNWEILLDSDKSDAIDQIITYFQTEKGEEIGVIAAEEILDQVLSQVAIKLYNQGVEDARGLLRGKMEDFDIDLSSLLKSH